MDLVGLEDPASASVRDALMRAWAFALSSNSQDVCRGDGLSVCKTDLSPLASNWPPLHFRGWIVNGGCKVTHSQKPHDGAPPRPSKPSVHYQLLEPW